MFDIANNIKKVAIIPGQNLYQDSSLRDALLLMEQYQVKLLPVLNREGSIAGVISKDNIIRRLVNGHESLPLMDFMDLNYNDDVYNPIDNLEMPKSDCILIDKQNNFVGILSKDYLTELFFKYNKQKLREKEAIFKCALNGIIILDKEGIITEMNPAAEKITGLLSEKTIGKRPEQKGLPANYVDALELGRDDYEQRLIHNGHTYILNRSPIIIENQVAGAVSIFQDITEIETVVNKLLRVEELNHQLETLINSSFDGIVVSDIEGNILKINAPAAQAFNIYQGAQQLPDCLSRLILCVAWKFDSITCQVKNHLGKELIVTANPIYNDKNEIVRIVYNIRDITELTELKNELEDTKELSRKYRRELDMLRNKYWKDTKIISRSPKMDYVIDLSLRVAEVDSTVLILGETGVGKQLVAELIHSKSNRREGPFIEINCGAIPENLLESELFGYEPGTFTGGLKNGKTGIFELADNGTIFLDEIGDLPLSLQVKLLKVLQNSEVVRLGGARPRKVNVRIVSATNKKLEDMIIKGLFREDLYYRLNIVPINIPPLRERKEDIVPIAYHFKSLLEVKYKKDINFAPEVMEIFLKHDWPGNVRELQNIVERLLVTAKNSVIGAEQAEPLFIKKKKQDSFLSSIVEHGDGIIPLKEARALLETKLVEMAMKKYGSTYKAAQALGVNQSTIARKAKKNNYDSS